MPSPLRDPKSLPEWIELDYYRRPGKIRRWRRLIVWAVLGAGLVGIALTFWPGKRSIYQAGPVSTAHAMFNEDCAQCHTEAFQTVRRLWPGNADVRSGADHACKTCHDGPLHHEQQTHEPSCATCHQEHRGRPKLAVVADNHCTACHAHLQRKDGRTCEFLNVRSFSKDHPEFALFRDRKPVDPAQLHFNHEVHLQPKGVRGHDGARVKLDCQWCHQPDAERRYMKPINYDAHCQSCHPLSVQIAGNWNEENMPKAVKEFHEQPAPHKELAVVRAALRDRFTEFVQRYRAVLDPDNGVPLDRFPPGPARPQAVTKEEWSWVDRQLQQTERVLFDGAGGCRYCHVKKEPVPALAWPKGLPTFEPTDIKPRWLKHGRFSHDSHRMLNCGECHPAATSKQTSDVLLPQIDNCKKCHNPQVGVRHDCIDCHRYHNRDRERNWKGRLTIADCLDKTNADNK